MSKTVVINPTATGSTEPRDLRDRFSDIVNVKDYGAKGDGTTSDDAAFTAAGATGKAVFVPGGTYKVTSSISGTFFGPDFVTINGGGSINYKTMCLIENTAAAHNSVYRGKDLTQVYTLEQIHQKLDKGDFSDLYVGDYITKTFTNPAGSSETADFVFADFDYWLGSGGGSTYTRKQGYDITDFECKFHHILMIPKDCFANTAQMNSTNTTLNPTSGQYPDGYMASNMQKLLETDSNSYAKKLSAQNVFGSYMKVFTDWECGKENTTAASAAGAGFVGSMVWFNNSQSGWDWVAHKLRLMHEPMVYGGAVFSSSGYEIGCGKSQLSYFRLKPDAIRCCLGRNSTIRVSYWLSAVASTTAFCRVHNDGYADSYGASNSSGVRPFFLIA